MALVYAAIANGGRLWLPQIVERVESPSGQVIEEEFCNNQLVPLLEAVFSGNTDCEELMKLLTPHAADTAARTRSGLPRG